MSPRDMGLQGSLTCQAVRVALQAAADGWLDSEQCRALDLHLATCAGCRAYQAELTALEARLACSLQARWAAGIPPSPEFVSSLGRIQSRARRQIMAKSIVRTTAWAAAVVVFVLFLTWTIRVFVPIPAGPAQGTLAGTPLPSLTAGALLGVTSSPAPTQPPIETVAEVRPTGVVTMFPNTEFVFAAPLPVEPTQATLYQQDLPEPLSVENARQMAARLGIVGEPASMQSEGPSTVVYEVTDGFNLVRFINFPELFVLSPQSNYAPENVAHPLSSEAKIAAAEAFLNRYGLLRLPYRAGINLRGDVEFSPLLDGHGVIFGIGDTSGAIGWARASVDPAGRVSLVEYSGHEFQPLGTYPILSAQQAWERLSAANASQRAMFAVLSSTEPADYRQWVRAYPTGKRVEVYGYLQIVAPPNGERQVWLNIWPVANDSALNGAGLNQYLHVWGQFVADAEGRLALSVESWEISPRKDDYLTGKIQRQGDQALLVADDGRQLRLPDISPALTDGTRVELSGVVQPGEPPTLQWNTLSSGQAQSSYGMNMTCMGGGGGGGGGPENANFGSGEFALVNRSAEAQPSPTPTPSLFQVGQMLEGVSGQLTLYMHQYLDGHTILEGNFYVASEDPSQVGQLFYLEGPDLQGSEPYQNLPMKIWGKVQGFREGVPVVTVERFAEVYPGLRLQAWLGITEVATLEGQEALVLTAQDGKQYVLKNSINCGADCQVGLPGDSVLYEGYVLPDQTFAGYPLLVELSAGLGVDVKDLGSYQITSGQIEVWADNGSSAGFNPDYLDGQVNIDQVELAYSAISLQGCQNTPENAAVYESWLYVQPIWVFTGHFEDGRVFLIQVQALPDQYLK